MIDFLLRTTTEEIKSIYRPDREYLSEEEINLATVSDGDIKAKRLLNKETFKSLPLLDPFWTIKKT